MAVTVRVVTPFGTVQDWPNVDDELHVILHWVPPDVVVGPVTVMPVMMAKVCAHTPVPVVAACALGAKSGTITGDARTPAVRAIPVAADTKGREAVRMGTVCGVSMVREGHMFAMNH